MQTSQAKKALLVGASGFIGHYCLQYLLECERYSQVIIMVRQSLNIQHPKLRELVVSFSPSKPWPTFPTVDHVYCCLGLPLKQMNAKRMLYRIDCHLPKRIAKEAKQAGASRFLIVTSSGIGPRSPIFYCRVKFRAEGSIAAMGFESTLIFRPSLLLGKPKQKRRIQQFFGGLVKPFLTLFGGPLKSYRPLPASVVAFSMVHEAGQPQPARRIINTHEMHCAFQTAAKKPGK